MSDNYVQSSSAGGVGTAVATLNGVVALNSLIAFFFNGTSSTPTVLSVADNIAGAYTAQGARAADASDNVVGQGFTLVNVASGTHIITGTTDVGASCFIIVVETGSASGASAFSGANQSHQSAPGTGANALTSGSVAVSAAATLIGFSTDSASVTPSDEPTVGTGFTTRDNNTSGVIGAYRLESGAFSSAQAALFTAPTGSHEFLTFGIAILNGGGAPADQPDSQISLEIPSEDTYDAATYAFYNSDPLPADIILELIAPAYFEIPEEPGEPDVFFDAQPPEDLDDQLLNNFATINEEEDYNIGFFDSPLSAAGGGPNIYVLTAGGTITFSGTAAEIKTRINAAGGTLVFSGSAAESRERNQVAGGTILFTGSATEFKTKLLAAGGNITFTGTAPEIKTKIETPSGSVIFSGHSGMIFIPAGGVAGSKVNRLNVKISRSIGL